MTPIRNLLSDAVRYGLAVGAVGIAGLASTTAFAQDTTTTTAPDTTKAKNLDRVEVIGSRIRRAVDTEPTQPVTTLTRADIAQTGLTSTYDIINHISASDGSGLSTVTTQTNGSDGSQFISLRNLGSQRTLVLVDGKRWTTDGFGSVDLSSIPVAIIERIDVLKDGASAIYGSDAIAGVINIITRKKFEGAEAGWYYGQTSHGDGAQNAEDVTIGANGDHSNVVIALSRSEQQAIFAGNRSISKFPVATCPEGVNTKSACGSFYSQFGVFYGPTVPDTNTFNVLNHSADNTSWAPGTKPSDYHPFSPADRYNYAPVNYLQQPAIRNNLYASGRFDITDNVSAYARVSYTQRQSSQQLAQVPTSLATSGGFGPQWAFGADAANVFNPFGGPVTTIGFRNVAVGPRHNNYDFNTLGSTVGLQGSFSFADRNFDWDVYGQYNSTRNTKIGLNYINLFNLQKGLGPSFADAGGLHCGTYDPNAANNGAIAGCMPFDIFSGPNLGLGNGYVRSDDPTQKYHVTAADVQAMVNYVSYTEVSASGDKALNYGANLSGEIVPLQGGMLSFAAGVEQRKERFFNQTDALVSGGGSSDNFVQPTKGETKVNEEYLELDAPLLKDLPGAKELEFDAAVRRSKYSADGFLGSTPFSTNPGSPTTKKFSVRWKPITDLLIRASYGDTFRAPQVGDLFAGGTENFPSANDPCNNTSIGSLSPAGQALCHAAGVPAGGVAQPNTQVRALAGGNPFLGPESGKNLTYGFVYSPSYVTGLNMTVDYWRITLHNAITAEGAQTFLDQCYIGLDPNACAFITRTAAGQIQTVQTGSLNVANLKVDGIDYGLTYKHDTAWGTFGLKWDTTYLRHESSNLGAGSDNVDVVGEYNGTPNWKFRSVATLDWTRGDWDASWTVRFMSKQDESCNRYKLLLCNHPGEVSGIKDVGDNQLAGTGFNRLGAVTYHDLQVGWKAPWKAHLAIGARNVFGKEPPLTVNSFANSFDAAYDLPGGPFYYFQYRQDF